MKKELVFSELTREQKLGLVLCANVNPSIHPDEVERALKMVREHRLGSVWVSRGAKGRDEILRRLNEEADYPIIIIGDAECGPERYPISQARAMGACGGDPSIAYTYGKVTAIELRKLGYNALNGPVVDISNYSVRHMSSKPAVVAKLGVAIAKGLHDGGLLSIAKHYPGHGSGNIDTHMQEAVVDYSLEKLEKINLRPYLEMEKAGVLDGFMTRHCRVLNVDPEHPCTTSKKVIDLMRDRGYEGFIVTDAMSMMGSVLKNGRAEANGLAVQSGNDCTLPWNVSCEEGYRYLEECYERGILTDEAIDTAVKHVLLIQHKANILEPLYTEIDEKDIENLHRVNRECISGHYAPGVAKTLPKDGKHLFVLLTERNLRENEPEPAGAVPFAHEWFFPHRIRDIVKETFPNSDVVFLPEYPSANDNMRLFDLATEHDDVVYVTSYRIQAYLGRECLTERVLAVMRALQTTNRIGAVLHFGSPHMIRDVPPVDRLLLGYGSEECVAHALRILAGEAEAVGRVPYDRVKIPVKK